MTPVHQIQPRNDQMQNEDRFCQPAQFRDQDRPHYDARFQPFEDGNGNDNYGYDREHYEEEYAR